MVLFKTNNVVLNIKISVNRIMFVQILMSYFLDIMRIKNRESYE